MQIKHVPEADYDAALKLDEFSFQSKIPKDIRSKVKEQLKWESIIGIYEGDRIAAKLSILPLACYINGKTFQMGGIASVATWPEYRRQGMVKKLLKSALYEMREKKQTISFLDPFSYAFYRKYGWELTFNEKLYTIPMERFRKKWDGRGYVKSVKNNIPLLHDIYTTYARRYNGMLTREELVWEHWVIKDSHQIVVAYNDDDEPEGYVIYKVEKEVLDVKEFAYTSINGWNVLLQFIANHDSMAKKVKMVVPENDQLALLLDEPKMEQKIESYMMARIVDVGAFLRDYAFQACGKSFSAKLHITDDFLPENTGAYYLQHDGTNTTVTAVKASGNPRYGIQCRIQQLTAIMVGFSRPLELLELGHIHGQEEEVEKLEALVPRKQPYLIDSF